MNLSKNYSSFSFFKKKYHNVVKIWLSGGEHFVGVGIVGPGIHWAAKFGHINSIALVHIETSSILSGTEMTQDLG